MKHLRQHPLIRLAVIPALLAGMSFSAAAQGERTETRAGADTQATAMHGTQSAAYRGVRASELIGMSVRNAKDENIGQISDMIVDLGTGDVRYAVLEFDPGILEGERLYAVPTDKLRMAADRDDVVYEIDRSRLERAWTEQENWDEDVLDDSGYLARLDTVWGIEQPGRGADAHRASDLIGKDVNNASGDDIGEVEDLVIDMGRQQVHYAVLDLDEGWATGEQNHAVPLRGFELSDDRDELVLDMDKSKLQALQSFPDSRYGNLDEPGWRSGLDRSMAAAWPTAGTAAGALNAGYAENPAPTELFTRLDENSDGMLDRDEAANLTEGEGKDPWSRLDDDSNGNVSRQEFLSGYPLEAAPR